MMLISMHLKEKWVVEFTSAFQSLGLKEKVQKGNLMRVEALKGKLKVNYLMLMSASINQKEVEDSISDFLKSVLKEKVLKENLILKVMHLFRLAELKEKLKGSFQMLMWM